jgi:hypothetical protein
MFPHGFVEILASVGKVLASVSTFQQLLTIVGKCWQISANIGKYQQVSASVANTWGPHTLLSRCPYFTLIVDVAVTKSR